MKRTSLSAMAAILIATLSSCSDGKSADPTYFGCYPCPSGYVTLLAGSYATIGGTTYDLVCEQKAMTQTGVTSDRIVTSALTCAGEEVLIDASVYTEKLYTVKQVTTDNATTVTFLGVTYIVDSGQVVQVRPSALDPKQIYTDTSLNTNNGLVSFNIQEP